MDEKSFSFIELFKENQAKYIRFAYSYIRDAEMAEDFVMDAMFEFWKNKEFLNEGSNISAYIITVIKNKCLNFLCHQKVRDNAVKGMTEIEEWNLETRIHSLRSCNPEMLFFKEIKEIVVKTLSSLSPRTKQIFMMSRYGHLSYKEIADRTGLTVKGVEFHIGKALKVLRIALKDYLGVLIFFL